MAVLWADVSYYQIPVNDQYPHPVLCIRSNDGTYRDKNFPANYAWSLNALRSGKLAILIVYCVWRPNWRETANTMIDMVGLRAPAGVVAMIDVESWGGQIRGDQSSGINAMYEALSAWLGDRRRVIGYGNRGDLDSLWRSKPPGIQLIVASYGRVPAYPGMIGHQYADNQHCPPFGPCDGNRAEGHTAQTLAVALGVGTPQRRNRKVSPRMEVLPATPRPSDPNADPTSWPQRNYDIPFDAAGGWEGDCAVSFGGQDWSGRNVDGTRTFLHIASWMLKDGKLAPVREGDTTPYVAGKGRLVEAHRQLGPWKAPGGAIGITLNYAAPGEGYVTTGRSA